MQEEIEGRFCKNDMKEDAVSGLALLVVGERVLERLEKGHTKSRVLI